MDIPHSYRPELPLMLSVIIAVVGMIAIAYNYDHHLKSKDRQIQQLKAENTNMKQLAVQKANIVSSEKSEKP